MAEKRGPGRPKKTSNTSNTSAKPSEDLDSFQRSLAEIETRLSSQIAETVSRSLAPLKSLIASLQTVLDNKIESLETEFRQFVDSIESTVKLQVDEAIKQAFRDGEPAAARNATQPPDSSTTTTVPIARSPPKVTNNQERKFNIIIYGVPECPKGSHWTNRASRDLNSVTSILSNIESSVTSHSVRDCHRLGKFSEASNRPRPILVELNQAHEVTSILSKRGSLKGSHIVIKPDMSPSERNTEQILLKQRWSLIQSEAADSQSIRIRGSRLLINGRVHGQVIDSHYCTHPLLSDHVSPHLDALASPINTSSVATKDPINTQRPSAVVSDGTICD